MENTNNTITDDYRGFAFVINLEERLDRWKTVQAAWSDHFQLIRIDAVKHAHGAVGCSRSHAKAIEEGFAFLRRQKGTKTPRFVVVLEDDAVPTPAFVTDWPHIQQSLETSCHPWQVANLAPSGYRTAYHTSPVVPVNDFLVSGTSMSTAFMCYSTHFELRSLAALREHNFDIEPSTEKALSTSMDIDLWLQERLTTKHDAYICHRVLAIQAPSYSNILGKFVDYGAAFAAGDVARDGIWKAAPPRPKQNDANSSCLRELAIVIHARGCELEPEVTLDVKGQLGNLLFQIAALYAHCLKNGCSPRIRLVLKPEIAFLFGSNSFLEALQPLLLLADAKKDLGEKYTEPRFGFNAIPSSSRHLEGYFQSSRHFADYKSAVLDMLRPPAALKDLVVKRYGQLFDPRVMARTIVVHVRRGDYLKYPTIHGILTPVYFHAAIRALRARLGDHDADAATTSVLIFSDDVAFCRGEFPYAECIDEPNESIALCLMSSFQNYVASNSSFSWWAIYLGTPAVHVIAPDPWFGPGGPQDFTDIYESTWTRMHAE